MASGGHIIGSGFTPDERKSGWWATDSRRSVSGHLVDVLLEKQGKKDRPDLSDIEAVQMGLRMQPVIGRIFEDTVGVKVRDPVWWATVSLVAHSCHCRDERRVCATCRQVVGYGTDRRDATG